MRSVLLAVSALILLPACLGPIEETPPGQSSAGTSGSTSAGTSASPSTTGASCKTDGVICGSGAECCSGSCAQGVCGYPHDTATGTTSRGTIAGPASTTGTTGVGTTAGPASTTGTTGSGGCACTTDADCNDAYHQGYICDGSVCRFGPNVGAVSSSGGACASPSSSTSSTTGSATTGGVVCGCATDADCNDAYHQGYICAGNVCRMGPNSAAASSSGGACAQGGGTNSNTSGGSTPLVLRFGDAPIRFTQAPGAFELSGQGASVQTDWVAAATPWLALDRNGNGTIDDGSELFGSMTQLGARTATNGFEALAALDANHDGRIDSKDPAFAKLVLWSDANQDRRSSPDELTPLAKAGVVAIELSYATSVACDGRGNCARERAAFIYADAHGRLQRGEVADVWLRNRPTALSVR